MIFKIKLKKLLQYHSPSIKNDPKIIENMKLKNNSYIAGSKKLNSNKNINEISDIPSPNQHI